MNFFFRRNSTTATRVWKYTGNADTRMHILILTHCGRGEHAFVEVMDLSQSDERGELDMYYNTQF